MLKNAIPFVDLRGKTPIELLRAYPDKARTMVSAATRMYGGISKAASRVALPYADWRSHNWLKRTKNPYLYEIESMADIVRAPGMYSLNLSYEWACTTGAYRSDETLSLLRVLDWPFPELGRHVMVVLQSGKAGEFYNVTWPGLSGVFTALAPGRFAAAINQAPMRKHRLGFIGDWVKNRIITRDENGIPPSHLLRQVFEQAPSYEIAKDMLTRTPLAVPAIFTLAGTGPGEGCVIERLENASEVFDIQAGLCVTAANQFESKFAGFGAGWRPREIDSPGRLRQSKTIVPPDLDHDNFNWLRPPIINSYTRLCLIANAATNRLMLQGYEGAMSVTEMFNLPAAGAIREKQMG